MDMPRDTMDEVSDETLLRLYANGDATAARLLTARLSPRVLGYATRLLADRAEAEDITQEAMMRLWRIAPQWRTGEAQISTWLYRVVTNLCSDLKRSRRTRAGVGLDDAPEVAAATASAVASLMQADRMTALHRALDQLPDRQRQAVVLRHIEGLANPEIAQIMELGIEAVESLTARGKRTLAAILAGRKAELGYEDDADEREAV
ncbi:MAG: RNA polymerase sigma factor [Pseudomonadota bacterium]